MRPLITIVAHHYRIYRSVPKELGVDPEKEIAELEKKKRDVLRRGTGRLRGPNPYDELCNRIEELERMPKPEVKPEKVAINPGDWVSISRAYVVGHGRSNLSNKFRVISKTVHARDIFCGGDLTEWGYDPQPR